MTRKSPTDRRRVAEGIGRAQLLRRDVCHKLYQRLISPGGPASIETVAEVLGVTSRSIYRQTDPASESPPQICTLVALGVDDPEGAREVLETVNRSLGYGLPEPLKDALEGCAVEAASEAGALSCELASLIIRAIHDGQLCEAEQQALRASLPGVILSLQRLAGKLDGAPRVTPIRKGAAS